MNGHEEEPGSLSWQEAWVRERIHVGPQGGSEACSGKVMCTAGWSKIWNFEQLFPGSLRGLYRDSVPNAQQ